MTDEAYMQKQAAWNKAADKALTKQAADLNELIAQVTQWAKENPQLAGSLLGGTLGAGAGAVTAGEDDNTLARAALGGLAGAGLGAGAGWLADYINRPAPTAPITLSGEDGIVGGHGVSNAAVNKPDTAPFGGRLGLVNGPNVSDAAVNTPKDLLEGLGQNAAANAVPTAVGDNSLRGQVVQALEANKNKDTK